MSLKRREGRALVWVVLLALLIGGAGAAGTWNYQRNAATDDAVYRPYRGYSASDLDALRAAYTGEVEALRARHTSTGARAGGQVRGGGLFAEQVKEFERVQQASAGRRARSAQLAEREAALAELETEAAWRESESDPTALFLRRLLTLP